MQPPWTVDYRLPSTDHGLRTTDYGGILSVALSLSLFGRWALPTTASCGARTFLSPVGRQKCRSTSAAFRAATVRPACRLIHYSKTFLAPFLVRAAAAGHCPLFLMRRKVYQPSGSSRYASLEPRAGQSTITDEGRGMPFPGRCRGEHFSWRRPFDPDGDECYDGCFRLCIGLAFGPGS
jgi:hypothetical protein